MLNNRVKKKFEKATLMKIRIKWLHVNIKLNEVLLDSTLFTHIFFLVLRCKRLVKVNIFQ